MGDTFYASVSLFVLTIWIVTQITWMRQLRTANGTRPFIHLTLGVGTLNTLMCAVFVVLAFHKIPEAGSWTYYAGLSYRVVSLLTCALMWQLHYRLQINIHEKDVIVEYAGSEESNG